MTRQQSKTWVFPALLVVALAIGRCEARPPWGQEIPTATALAPAATRQKELKPTPFNFVQAFVERRLRKRDEYPGSVCGFIGGDVASPALCSSNSICLWDTAHGAVGCSATDDGDLAFYTTCVDSNNDGVASLRNNQWAFTCASECYKNSYESFNGQGFTQWGCGRSSFATTVLTQPSGVTGQSAKVQATSIDMPTQSQESSSSSSSESSTIPPSSSSSSSSSSITESSTTTPPDSTTGPPPSTTTDSGLSTTNDSSTTGGSGESSTTSSSEPTNSTGSSTPTPGGGGSSTNVGAIAGGVVGGIAGLALIGGLLFLYLRERRNSQNLRRVSEASRTSLGPHDMGEIYEPKELDATTPEIPSELPGDSPVAGPSKPVPEPVELPGSEVPAKPAGSDTEKKV
ncbi:hypothetical protein H072_9533 [Dactylellina haptotyla CBS 200.50]|uniref:Uncharacterized protein n=1 Tax=Dactylellina haptotyla (strain CBS 200.50) TaxID=1284197 RepID=S8BCG6_DACHA|nr:hypothetical protein H072_9533 [Dactylellina haptotyla CBS 200.50]